MGITRTIHAVLGQEYGEVKELLPGVFHANVFKAHVAHGRKVAVVNAENRAIFDVNYVTITKENVPHFGGAQFKANLQTVAPGGVPKDALANINITGSDLIGRIGKGLDGDAIVFGPHKAILNAHLAAADDVHAVVPAIVAHDFDVADEDILATHRDHLPRRAVTATTAAVILSFVQAMAWLAR